MPKEIERKFITINDQWKQLADASRTEKLVQGYVESNNGDVRLRIDENAKTAQVCFKSRNTSGLVEREELRFSIPIAHAREMLGTICDATPHKLVRDIDCSNPGATDPAPKQQETIRGHILTTDATVRVRLCTNADGTHGAELCLKSKRDLQDGAIIRDEWQYKIPEDVARHMLAHVCNFSLEKTRYHVPHDGRDWTVDDLLPPSRYGNLKIAEIEFATPGESIALPPFVTAESEVTEDRRFTNRRLANPDRASDLAAIRDKVKSLRQPALTR